jgi:phosphate transport system substrate-binding protein
MGQTPVASSVREFTDFGQLRQALASDPDGIGYVSTGFSADVKPLQFTVRDRVAARPDVYGLATGDYPLANTVTLYHVSKDPDDIEAAFFRAARSPRAEYLVDLAGYVRVAPRLLLPRIDPPLPTEYQAITPNGLRVNTTIHFDAGSTVLSQTEEQKLDVLAAYLRNLAVPAEQLAHVGFSTDTGDQAQNLAISQQLGDIVAAALRRRSMVPGEVVPFGAALLLATNTMPRGQWLNRRVETWIRP